MDGTKFEGPEVQGVLINEFKHKTVPAVFVKGCVDH